MDIILIKAWPCNQNWWAIRHFVILIRLKVALIFSLSTNSLVKWFMFGILWLYSHATLSDIKFHKTICKRNLKLKLTGLSTIRKAIGTVRSIGQRPVPTVTQSLPFLRCVQHYICLTIVYSAIEFFFYVARITSMYKMVLTLKRVENFLYHIKQIHRGECLQSSVWFLSFCNNTFELFFKIVLWPCMSEVRA